jgi:radical SAM superfamily enzyme YgiQ (UPF0313 family)
MRIVLLRPPRFLWPFNSETSAFWQPLGLVSLAATARRDVPGVELQVIDAPSLRWGWQTLERVLGDRRIDVLGIGEETVSAQEGFRAARLVKRLHPDCLVVSGGYYYGHAIDDTLADGSVDVVVRGEGEATFAELLRHAADRSAWPGIRGIAFRDDGGGIRLTPPRDLIHDLDSLPFPAYDLLDMHRYGLGSRNHPGLVSVEHSRGCSDRCSFCILWKHMGKDRNGSGEMRPFVRTQSPERSFDTVLRLYREHGRRTFGWVDPTFNIAPQWSDRWAEAMLGSELMDGSGQPLTVHTAWMRADCVLRDQKSGILEKLVRAGVRQVMLGVERDDDAGLAFLDKHNNGAEVCREAFSIFLEKYPEVFTIGSVIIGLPGDTMADLKRLMACKDKFGMDYCFVIPLTPNPGTQAGQDAHQSGRVANSELASYNYHTPVCTTDSLSLRQLESVYWRPVLSGMNFRWLSRAARNCLLEPNPRKRRLHRSFLKHGTAIAAKTITHRLTHPFSQEPTLHSRKPPWYDA